MRMLDALHLARAKKRSSFGPLLMASVVALPLAAAVPLAGPKQDADSGLVEVLSNGKRSKELVALVEGTQARLKFGKTVKRVAVGEDVSVSADTLSATEVLLTARKVGSTTLTVWYEAVPGAEQATEQFLVRVERDLSVLQDALKTISTTIDARIAPDRDAVVLTGTVPDAIAAERAANAANAYLRSMGQRDGAGANGQVINLLRVTTASAPIETRLRSALGALGGKGLKVTRVQKGDLADDANDVFIVSGEMSDLSSVTRAMAIVRSAIGEKAEGQRVLNDLRVDVEARDIANELTNAIHSEGAVNVQVRRYGADAFGDKDIVVLVGKVADQTTLLRVLSVASKIFLQQEVARDLELNRTTRVLETDANGTTRVFDNLPRIGKSIDDIRVVGDEAGGLKLLRTLTGNPSAGTGIDRFLSGGSTGSGSSSSSDTQGISRVLENDLRSNLARATVIELAGGRMLSFIEVESVPQVRVDIRLLEVNRTALFNIDTFDGLQASVKQRGSRFGAAVGDTAGALNAIVDASTETTAQFAGSNFAMDAAVSLLETEGLARKLASPSLTVLSGEVAYFTVGGQIPIDQATGTATVVSNNVQFVDFGVSLAVRPFVGLEDMLTLDVAPVVKNPDAALTASIRQSSGTAPSTTAFDIRKLSTTARLRDGDTLVLGGLTNRNRNDNGSQTPWLGDIPLVGWLFKGVNHTNDDRELIVVINPSILRDRPRDAHLWAYPPVRELLKRPLPKQKDDATQGNTQSKSQQQSPQPSKAAQSAPKK